MRYDHTFPYVLYNYSSMSKHLAWVYIASSTRLRIEINKTVIEAIDTSQIIIAIAYLYELLYAITRITTWNMEKNWARYLIFANFRNSLQFKGQRNGYFSDQYWVWISLNIHFSFFLFFFAAELIQITFLVDGTLLCVRNLKHVERSVVFDELSAI